MTDTLSKAQDVFLDKINPICKKFGLNHIMARLYTILYFSDKPLSLDDMMKRLDISKGSVSTNIRALERYGAVRRAWIRGSRKDFYEAETDILKLLTERVRAMARDRLSEIDDMISSSLGAIDSIDPKNGGEQESITKIRKKIEDIKSIHMRAQGLLDLFSEDIVNNLLSTKSAEPRKEEAAYNGISKNGA